MPFAVLDFRETAQELGGCQLPESREIGMPEPAVDTPRRTLRVLRMVTRSLLVAFACLWFGFALLSGAAQHGEGFQAVLRNFANTLPWLGLFVVVYLAFRNELLGGLLIIVAGLASAFFFNAFASPLILFAISLPLLALGGALLLCWAMSRPR